MRCGDAAAAEKVRGAKACWENRAAKLLAGHPQDFGDSRGMQMVFSLI